MAEESPIMWFPTGLLAPNEFNPNVMPAEEYEAMKKEIEADPVKFFARAPVIVTPYDIYHGRPWYSDKPMTLIIVDGEHRWRAATELNVERIATRVFKVTMDEVKREVYRINKQRGTIDPLKEMELWWSEAKEGKGELTHQEIADKYGVERSQVSKTLSLKRLPKLVQRALHDPWEAYQMMGDLLNQDDEMTPESIHPLLRSHVEPMVTLPADEAIELAYRALVYGYSVRHIESNVQTRNEIRERNQKTIDILRRAKMKNCPICGSTPDVDVDDETLSCSNYCRVGFEMVEWDVDTTKEDFLAKEVKLSYSDKREYEELKEEEGEEEVEPPKERTIGEILETKTTIQERKKAVEELKPDTWFKIELEAHRIDKELGQLMLFLARELVDAKNVHVEGWDEDGNYVELSFDADRTNRYFNYMRRDIDKPPHSHWDLGWEYRSKEAEDYERWPEDRLHFTYNPGNWKTGDFKTRVDLSHEHEGTADRVLPAVKDFLEQLIETGIQLEPDEQPSDAVPYERTGISSERAKELIMEIDRVIEEKGVRVDG